ncbi:hypothetical protein [Agromyces neolithicus]|uniref:CopG family transcriptional regulator n=1 Tax=Agromyces neolithicus TaxID=269420 RepID=A0ABN2M7Z1_9MICO
MAGHTIRIDESTQRLVADLAYLLDVTKKSIVSDAIAEFAESRGSIVRADGRATFEQLSVTDRLTLRRSELIRAFAARDASEVRVMHTDAGVIEGYEPPLTLLVTTDIGRGGGEADELARIATRMLRATVHVESATRLELFDHAGLRRARENSTPL